MLPFFTKIALFAAINISFLKSAYNFGSGNTFKNVGLRRVIKSLRTLGLAVGLIYVHNRDSTGIEL